MITKNLLLTKNWEERHEAERLGMPLPKQDQIKTRMLFWKEDIKRIMIGQDTTIIITFKDDECYEMEYDEKLWRELEAYFKKNEIH